METNVIYCGDNLEVLPKYIDHQSHIVPISVQELLEHERVAT